MTDAAPTTPDAPPVAERSIGAVLRELLPFLRPYAGRILLAMACLVAAKLANLGVPLVLKALVDGLDVEPSLLVLGFVLGPWIETHLRRALLLARGDWSVFVTRPVSATLLGVAVLVLLVVLLPRRR